MMIKWKELNKKHVSLANKLNRLFGGPETDDPNAAALIAERSAVAKEKWLLEEAMTDEEFSSVYSSRELR